MADFTIAPQEWTADMWREAIKGVVRFGAQPHENPDDIVSAGWVLGQKRALLRGRKFWPAIEIPPGLTILCFVVFFKPAYSIQVRQKIIERRWPLIEGIHSVLQGQSIQDLVYTVPGDNEHARRILDRIPDDLLTMPVDRLEEMITRSDGGFEVLDRLGWL